MAELMPVIQVNGHTFFSNGLSARSRVLDLGANRGTFAREVHERFGCECTCVEPDPAVLKDGGSSEGIRVVNAAIAPAAGRVAFHVSGNSEASSMIAAPDSEWGIVNTVEVDALTLTDCLSRVGWNRVDLIKMDIEGAEIGVLESCPAEVLAAVPQLTVEFHDFCGITPRADIERVIRRLEKIGFGAISFWHSSHGDVLFVQRRKVGVGLVEFLIAKYWLKPWWSFREWRKRRLTAAQQPA